MLAYLYVLSTLIVYDLLYYYAHIRTGTDLLWMQAMGNVEDKFLWCMLIVMVDHTCKTTHMYSIIIFYNSFIY